jgi:hypothetical protein
MRQVALDFFQLRFGYLTPGVSLLGDVQRGSMQSACEKLNPLRKSPDDGNK